jgi:hypothetical protein
MFVLAASEVLRYGLGYVGLTERAKGWKPKRQELEFHKHYGSSSVVNSSMWVDLLIHSDLKKTRKERKDLDNAWWQCTFLVSEAKKCINTCLCYACISRQCLWRAGLKIDQTNGRFASNQD